MTNRNLYTLLIISLLPFTVLGQKTISFQNVSNGELRIYGFLLEENRTINIHAVGAGYSDGRNYLKHRFDDTHDMFAYAWILNADTRRLEWRMTMENTRSYTGSDILREFENTVSLSAGRYELYYSARQPREKFIEKQEWPDLADLLKRLLGKDKWDEDIAQAYRVEVENLDKTYTSADVRRYQKVLLEKAVVALCPLRDSEHREEKFTLTEPAEFELYALGEALDSEAVDHYWIENLDQWEDVWTAEDARSKDGGGALKNREWREHIRLDPGNYSVNGITDDSHSYADWNANPPYDPSFWGIVLIGVPGKFNPASIKPYVEKSGREIIKITRVGNSQLVEENFIVEKKSSVRIIALGEGDDNSMYDYGWIEDVTSGRKVWQMFYDDTRHAGGGDKNRMVDRVIELNPGTYRLAYRTDDSHAYNDWNVAPPRRGDRWGVTIFSTSPEGSRNIKITDIDELSKPVVELEKVGNDEVRSAGFEVRKRTMVRIVGLGEGSGHEMHDYGWIEKARTGERVWEMSYEMSKHAGGARKNRLVDTKVSLDPGSYTLYFQTDDSHAYGSWNSSAPYDGKRWGIAIYADESGTQNIAKIDKRPVEEVGDVVVRLTGISSDKLVHALIDVQDDVSCRVVAVGEGGSRDMSDYGWIVSMEKGETIWRMKAEKSQHAGGGRKNRRVQDVIELEEGLYTVYFKTDDSHAYGDWNDRPPDSPEEWGITLYTLDKDDSDEIKVIKNLDESEYVVARIYAQRDDEHRKRMFSLGKDKDLFIYALGEGFDGEMYDYGWIEDRTSREVVWVMEYGDSEWAGGAQKNRVVTDHLDLPAGDYILHYTTDDSHSPHEWNSYAPHDPENYGITLILDAR